ncbi:MAG: FAD-dependent oxidoreductase [Patescibacteria group bacterium]
METKQYDVVVIGAGSGGLTAAVGFSRVGKKVLLVEREHMGGECTNSGCVPSKALLHHAKEYYRATQVAGKSVEGEAFRARAFTYVRDIVNHILAEETPETFQKIGIDVVMGEAVFHSKCSLTVGGLEYRYTHAVIATGSSPRLMSIPGLDQADILTNQNIFTLSEAPEKLLIIGAGPIGLEMGQAFAMLGSHVTITAIDTEFGRLEDVAIRPVLRSAFEKLGVHIELNAFINRIEGKEAVFDIKNGTDIVGEKRVSFDKVLIAIGRVPNIPPGLEKAGIKHDANAVLVDSQYRTSNKQVYALGDVAQRLKFTHTADDTARQVVAHVVSKGLLRVNRQKAVPKVTYTLPEVAQVGMSWDEARKKYTEDQLMRVEVPFTQNDRAKTDEATDGLLVVIARRLSGTVLGAHLIGPAAGELITIFTLAIDQKISLWSLQGLIYAYPTYSLIVKKAGDQFVARQFGDLKKDIGGVFRRNAPKLIAGLFWLSLIFGFQQYRISNHLSYADVLLSLLDFFTSTVWGPITYMVLYAVRPLILFPATLLTALSGALFGFWWGILFTIIGENASANFAYSIGRFFGKGLRLEDTIIGNWVEKLRNNSFEAVLLMRLFYVPFDLTNYGSGVVGAKWREYFLATLIGIMPGLTTFVALGAAVDLEELRTMGLSFDAFDPKFLALSVVIFVVSLFFSKALKKWRAEA